MQCVLQAAQRQRPSLLCFQSSFERDDAAGLVPEVHLAALLVFDQVRGEYMVLRAPRPQQHAEFAEPRIPRLGPQLLQRKQAGVAAGLDDEVRLVRSPRHRQR